VLARCRSSRLERGSPPGRHRSPEEEALFESGPAKDDVGGHAGALVCHGKHPHPLDGGKRPSEIRQDVSEGRPRGAHPRRDRSRP
jgi:hypothetical protein